MNSPLIPLVTILGAVIIAVAVTWFITYYLQRAKIAEMKREGRKALREARREEYAKGYKAAQDAGQDPVLVQAIAKAYQDGYDDGVANERAMSEVEETLNTGRHRWTNDIPTNMFPLVKSDTKTGPLDEETCVLIASDYTPDGENTAVLHIVSDNAA